MPQGCERAFIIFNTLPWKRTEVVSVKLPKDAKGAFVDANGKTLASSRLKVGDETEWLVKVDEIPPFGYTAIYFVRGGVGRRAISDINAGPNFIENEYYRISANRNGTLDILSKADGKVYSGLLLFEDAEDAGDEYDYSPIEETHVITTENEVAKVRVHRCCGW
jgi:mannosylglycerate hydrolase